MSVYSPTRMSFVGRTVRTKIVQAINARGEKYSVFTAKRVHFEYSLCFPVFHENEKDSSRQITEKTF